MTVPRPVADCLRLKNPLRWLAAEVPPGIETVRECDIL
jgi:hypothetical protein